jgi:hypothetical protein
MDPGLAAILGAVVGGAIAFTSVWLRWRLEYAHRFDAALREIYGQCLSEADKAFQDIDRPGAIDSLLALDAQLALIATPAAFEAWHGMFLYLRDLRAHEPGDRKPSWEDWRRLTGTYVAAARRHIGTVPDPRA